MNFKNLLVSAATIIVLIASAYVIYYDGRVNPSLEPTWNSPIELSNFDLAKLPLKSIYDVPQGKSVFRLWINPSFNHQSVIQLTFSESSANLKVIYYQIDYTDESISVISSNERNLSSIEIDRFQSKLVESQFLHIRPSSSYEIGMDGTNWAIEANIKNMYLSDAGWELERDSFIILRNAIIDLTNKSLNCLQIDCNRLRQ